MENDMRKYGFDEVVKFIPVMPEVIAAVGATGELNNPEEVSNTILDKGERLNTSNLVAPDFAGLLDKESK